MVVLLGICLVLREFVQRLLLNGREFWLGMLLGCYWFWVSGLRVPDLCRFTLWVVKF